MKIRILTLIFFAVCIFKTILAQPQRVNLAPAANQTYTDAISEVMSELDKTIIL